MSSALLTSEQGPGTASPVKLRVRCQGCGRQFLATTHIPSCCPGALVTSDYTQDLDTAGDRRGLWRFLSWLPVREAGPTDVGSVTYRSRGLAAALGLEELWISANGYGSRGACPTGSFKDLEAAPTFQLLGELGVEGVVVASAGNTARAFAHLGSELGVPVLVIVAEKHLDRVWNPGGPFGPSVHVFGIEGGTYADASRVAAAVAPRIGWALEGGARNLARRDGIGTLLLDAVATTGRLPLHYVQAVGGGAGPIACFETALRLIATGEVEGPMPRFHLAQNATYRPVDRAWTEGRDRFHAADLYATGPVFADILVSASPVYADRGGLFDLLAASDGHTYPVEASAATEGLTLLDEEEGIEAHPAAGIAVAALRQAVAGGTIPRDESVLLAVTGMGEPSLIRDKGRFPAEAEMVVNATEAADRIVECLG